VTRQHADRATVEDTRSDRAADDDPPSSAATSRRRLLAGVASLAAAGALAGCSSDPQPTPARSPTPPPTDARERFPDYEWSLVDEADPVATDTVVMRAFDFRPLVATMPSGTEVTVTNDDSAGHEITVPRLGVDEVLDGGESVSFVVEEPGTYDYVCEYHPPDMLGRLVVEEG
jgi:plastocyanin